MSEIILRIEKNIGATILRKIAKNFSHSYENNLNKIKIQLLSTAF